MSADPRFDRRAPSYAPGTVVRVVPLIPPPLRREPAPVRVSGGVLLPAPIDVGLDSALPHEAYDAPDGSGLPHDGGEEVLP